jgi:hypothetical protein
LEWFMTFFFFFQFFFKHRGISVGEISELKIKKPGGRVWKFPKPGLL